MPTPPRRQGFRPEGRVVEQTNWNTGYRTVYHEIDMPDRKPGEPHSIRAQATETGPNKWAVRVVHGPHDERDATGSYYNQVGDFSHEGPLGSLKKVLKGTIGEQWTGIRPP